MRKLLVAGIILFGSVCVYAAPQPHNIGYVTTDSQLGVWSRTLAQIDALTPDSAGQIVYCSDCEFALCTSSGTGRGAFVVVGSTVPAASSFGAANVPMHCQ